MQAATAVLNRWSRPITYPKPTGLVDRAAGAVRRRRSAAQRPVPADLARPVRGAVGGDVLLAARLRIVLTLALAFPTAGFLVRTFIVFHDCGPRLVHADQESNASFGIIAGLLVFNPYFWCGRFDHAGHHASSGDLDRRGAGDIDTWTISEYRAKLGPRRLGYRLMRSPYVMRPSVLCGRWRSNRVLFPFPSAGRVGAAPPADQLRRSRRCSVGALACSFGWAAVAEDPGFRSC